MPQIGATRLANITGLDCVGIPVATVCRPQSRSISVSQGKGLTLAAAKASALMEALEHYSAERPVVRLRRASVLDMRRRGEAFAWAGLPMRSAAPPDENAPILWAHGQDLSAGGARVWVPFSIVHMDWTHPVSFDSSWFALSSNGLASGNHFLEAVSHALCEVVERDAKCLWQCTGPDQREARRLRLSTVDDSACREVLARVDAAGLRATVWDMTSDVGIPAFISMVADDRGHELAMPPFWGEGCHPAREIALLRSLTEAAQSRLTFIAGSRDDVRRADYAKRLDPTFIRSEVAAARVGEAERTFLEIPSHDGATLEEDVIWELQRLQTVGASRIVVVDLTSEELGVPVVRVLVPGLEGAHEIPGYVAGPRARARLAEALR